MREYRVLWDSFSTKKTLLEEGGWTDKETMVSS